MKTSIKILGLFATLAAPLAAQTATIINYWDFETDFTDKVGINHGTAGADVSTTSGHDGNTAAFFPTEITGGGAFDDTGYVGISPEISNIGGGNIPFSFSYWVRLDYDDTINPRGIFDFSSDAPIATNGADGPQSLYIQTGGNAGNLAFRVDGTTGDAVGFVPVSAFEGTVGSPTGTWFFIAATFDPNSDLNIYLNGSATPSATIDATTVGTVNWEFVQYIGAFNVNLQANRGLEGGVDDLAIYREILSTAEIAGLHAGTIAPTDISAPIPGIDIISVDYNNGTDEITVVFASKNGSTYSVYGDTTLTTHAIWSELTGADITGDGTNKAFTYAPPGPSDEFFLEVRED